MKDMSYRDKMVILIISIIIILVAGFFALIRPTYNKMVEDTATYETTKTEWDGIKQKLDAIPALKETITSHIMKPRRMQPFWRTPHSATSTRTMTERKSTMVLTSICIRQLMITA